MKTRNSILSACGLASAMLAVGLPTILAQDDYQLADPSGGTPQQQGQSAQQQDPQQQPQWQQQRPRPQRAQQQQARQQDRQEWQQERQVAREEQRAWRQEQRPQRQQAQQQQRFQQQRIQQQQPQQQQQYTRLIAAIHGVGNNEDVMGTVQFDRESQGVRVVAEIGGLQDEELYSIRIHQFGDLGSKDAESVGESFNPGMDSQQQTIGTQQPRSQSANGARTRSPDQASLGDLGTVRSDSDGNIRVERTVTGLQLSSGESGILGRSVVIHRTDDAARQNPVGAGVIGISKDGLPASQARQTTTGQRVTGELRESD